MRRACLLSLFAVLVLPASGLALPGDEPIAPLEPTDGAVVPVNPDGIPVSFTCPEFRTSALDPESPNFGDSDDYFVDFASSPELGNNGRLRDDRLVDLGTSEPTNVGPPGRCVSAMKKDSALVGGVGPEETPGTYFWQVYRLCGGCETGSETGPVRSFKLRGDIKLALKVQSRAFTGYPVVGALRLAGLPDDAPVAVQRRVGKVWRTVLRTTASDGSGEAILVLPRGRQRLRVQAQVGNQRATSPVRVVRVERARGWKTSRADDGAYRGRGEGRGVRFRIAGRGRRLRAFSATVATFCPGPTVEQNRFLVGVAPLPRARIAPDGRFLAVARPGRDTFVRIRGRLRRGRVTGGRVELDIGTCSGSAKFSARRRRPPTG